MQFNNKKLTYHNQHTHVHHSSSERVACNLPEMCYNLRPEHHIVGYNPDHKFDSVYLVGCMPN